MSGLKESLRYGYIRNRKDGMSEYTIVGVNYVKEVLAKLSPYLKLKHPHAKLAEKITQKIPKRFTRQRLLAVAELVDQFQELNYSKKRKNTVDTLKKFLKSN